MIELSSSSYIIGFWYANDPKTNNDWMCCVQRDPENKNRFFGDYRFRYCKDDKIWNSDDEKKWTSFSSKEDETEEEIISKINSIQDHLSIIYKNKDRLLVQGGIEKFIELAPSKDWMNMKQMSLDEYKKDFNK